MSFYRRNLPHWQPENAEYFITFRLAGSLPAEVVADLKRRREELLRKAEYSSRNTNALSVLRRQIHRHIFQKYDHLLDKAETGPTWLSNESVANVVEEALHFRDQKQYDLYAYCIMSNHVHLVFRLSGISKKDQPQHKLSDYPVTNLMQKLKSYTAVHANQVLKRSGSFWHRESYDHVIRDAGELERTISYTLNNPVKAKLVATWKDWPYCYCKPAFLSSFST